MQKQNEKIDVKVEFVEDEKGNVEVRYFDTSKDATYLSWKLPGDVAKELILWWKKITKNKSSCFPVKESTALCEFAMGTEKHLSIKEFDRFGRHKMTGWNLPSIVAEKLVGWHKNEDCKEEEGGEDST